MMSRRYWILPEDTAGHLWSVVAQSLDWQDTMVRIAHIHGNKEDVERYINEVTARQGSDHQIPVSHERP